jgi:hypothetical protein
VPKVSAIINAIILLPVGAAIDGAFARQCITHIERRGYRLAAVLTDWASALTMTRSKQAEVVVIAQREHFEADWTPRIEFVGSDTRELIRNGRISARIEQSSDADDDPRNRRPGPAA